jgi:hypothetical protein
MTKTRATLFLLALAAVSTRTISAESVSSPSNLRGNWDGPTKPVGVDTSETALEGFRLRGSADTFQNELRFVVRQTHNANVLSAPIMDEDEHDESMFTTLYNDDDDDDDDDDESMVMTTYNDPETFEIAVPASDISILTSTRRVLNSDNANKAKKSAKKKHRRAKRAKRAKHNKADPKNEVTEHVVPRPETSDPVNVENEIPKVSPDSMDPSDIVTARTEAPSLYSSSMDSSTNSDDKEPEITVDRDALPRITEILLPEYHRSDDNHLDEENFPIFNMEGFLTEYPTSDNNDLDEENFPFEDVRIFNMEGFLTEYPTSDGADDIDSERIKSTLEAFDKAIEMSGSRASSDSLQLKYVDYGQSDPKRAPEVGCAGDVKLLKQRGGRSLMTSDPILDAVKIIQQGTSTVTVDLYQVWKNAPGYPMESFYYHFHKPGKHFWGNVECYEETSVPYSASERVDTIEISCNVNQPFAALELCLVDDISHGSLMPDFSREDSSLLSSQSPTIVPKMCNHEVSPTETAVCYTLEINCQPPSEDNTC